MEMEKDKHKKTQGLVPRPQLIYGQVVYWITVATCILCLVGVLVALIRVEANVLNPHFVFARIWEGATVEKIWDEAGFFPGGHFYLMYFPAGDAIIQFAMVLGGSVALWGMLGAAFGYFKEKSWGYVIASLFVALVVVFAMTGVVQLK